MDLEELNKKKQQNISLILLKKTHKYNKNSIMIIIKTSKITKPLKFYFLSIFNLIFFLLKELHGGMKNILLVLYVQNTELSSNRHSIP